MAGDAARTVDLDDLERRARRVIEAEGHDGWYDASWFREEDDEFPESDAAFIAAVGPATVLALAARIRELESALRLTSDAVAPQTGHAIGVLLEKGAVLP